MRSVFRSYIGQVYIFDWDLYLWLLSWMLHNCKECLILSAVFARHVRLRSLSTQRVRGSGSPPGRGHDAADRQALGNLERDRETLLSEGSEENTVLRSPFGAPRQRVPPEEASPVLLAPRERLCDKALHLVRLGAAPGRRPTFSSWRSRCPPPSTPPQPPFPRAPAPPPAA